MCISILSSIVFGEFGVHIVLTGFQIAMYVDCLHMCLGMFGVYIVFS